MANAQSKLDILINAKNQASPAVKQLTGELQGMDKAAGGLSKGLSGLAAGVGVAGLVALGTAAAATGMELARLSAVSQDVETAMGNLAAQGGESADAMLAGIREASRGAISDYDLMLSANRAMLLGVADNTDDLTALMDVARARSQAMGITTAQAFGDIVTGIGRMSPMILDNLGIVVDQANANEAYAASVGKVAAQLTDQEKKQALVNAVIRDSADLVRANVAAGDDAASTFERMDAAAANAKVALGELFAPGMVESAKAIADATNLITAALERQTDSRLAAAQAALEQTRAELSFQFLPDGRRSILEDRLRAQAAALAEMSDANQRAQYETGEVEAAFNRLGGASGTASTGLANVGMSATATEGRLAALKAQADETAAAIDQIKTRSLGALDAAASSAVSVMGSNEVSRIYAEQKRRLDGQISALEKLGYNTDELKFKSQELADKAALPFTLAVDAAREAERSSKSYAKTLSGDMVDAAQEAEQAFNSLRGKVEGVLSGALNTGVTSADSIMESMGLRPDAINEDARRLADVAVKGWESPWADYFRTKFPTLFDDMYFGGDNIKAIAAQQLKDFEDGLNPELIDKGKAKDRIRRMLLGEANMAELAVEIANELAAEMGVPLQQALGAAQGALGVGGTTGVAGNEAAQTFQDGAEQGIAERNGGGAMVDSFIAQARASYSKLTTAGKDAGRMWGAGFMETVGESVPPALIDLLTTLVTPGVMAKFAQQGSLTGAN